VYGLVDDVVAKQPRSPDSGAAAPK
jgi:hypothetical protein